MSCFINCECCDQIAQKVCRCSSNSRYFCNRHIIDHINLSGDHLLTKFAVDLSEEEISSLEQALKQYLAHTIQKTILAKTKTINSYLQRIKKAEQECSSIIKGLISGKTKKTIEKLISKRSLPLFSHTSLLKRLASLKNSGQFSISEILQELLSFSSQSSSDKTILHKSSFAELSIQTIPGQTIDPIPQWKLSKRFKAHDGGITSIAVSDCQEYFASGSFDKTIKIWKAKTCDLIRTLQGHTDAVTSVSFRGKQIVSGSQDNSIKIWEEGACINTLDLHTGWVLNLCVSYSKTLIASGSQDKKVIVYNLKNNKILHTLQSHSDWVRSVLFTQNDKEIVSGSLDRSIKVWKTKTGELLRTIDGHSEWVLSVKMSGEVMVSSSKDNSVRLWKDGEEECVAPLRGHTSIVQGLDVCNNLAASMSNDDSIRIWDIENRKQIQTFQAHGRSDSWFVGSVKFLHKERWIVSGGYDKCIQLWEKRN